MSWGKFIATAGLFGAYDKISIFSLVSLTNLSLKLQFCMKKAAMKLSSLPLKMSVSYRNRTYNRVLGARDTTVNTYND